MISYLIGAIKYTTDNSIIVLVQGLGYEVFINKDILNKYQIGDVVEFFIYQNVREDALTLFGFVDYEALDLFKKLISVAGVGPKTAMGILEIANVGEIIASIQKNDPNLLTKVSGIGKKTAERVVLELKNKVNKMKTDGFAQEQFADASDEIDALIALGYSASQAREALGKVSPEITRVGARVKEALKYINNF